MSEQTPHKAFRYSNEEDEVLLLRMRELAETPVDPSLEFRSLLSFRIGDQVFALRTRDVLQVVSGTEILSVPQSPESIIGITNIRGEIITVCDTSILLLGSPLQAGAKRHLLYLHHDEYPLCFAIEGTPESITVNADDITPPSPDDTNPNIQLIEAYVRHGNDYIQILRVDTLLNHRLLSKLLSSSNAEQP